MLPEKKDKQSNRKTGKKTIQKKKKKKQNMYKFLINMKRHLLSPNTNEINVFLIQHIDKKYINFLNLVSVKLGKWAHSRTASSNENCFSFSRRMVDHVYHHQLPMTFDPGILCSRLYRKILTCTFKKIYAQVCFKIVKKNSSIENE